MEKFYRIGGMNCQACAINIEKKVASLKGVKKADVFALDNLLKITCNFSVSDSIEITREGEDIFDESLLIEIVENLGYSITPQETNNIKISEKSSVTAKKQENETSFFEKLKQKTANLSSNLYFHIILGLPLLYFSMGHMLGLPLPAKLLNSGNYFYIALAQAFLTLSLMLLNIDIYVVGLRNLRKKIPNMDTLIAIGTLSAFVYSTYLFLRLYYLKIHTTPEEIHNLLMQLHFESSGTILLLIKIGKKLEEKAKNKTNKAIEELKKLKVSTARRIGPYGIQEVELDLIMVGDAIEIKDGMSIPVDGIVKSGYGIVNEATLNGESIPKEKVVGDFVYASTINEGGNFIMQVTQVGRETLFEKMINLVEKAQLSKTKIETLANRISYYFVPIVLALAILTFGLWLFFTSSFHLAILSALSVLIISCPCALGLATPLTIKVALTLGSRMGLLLKTADILEETRKLTHVFFDKTGTLTLGEPRITDYYLYTPSFRKVDLTQMSEFEFNLLKLISAIEQKSSHPLAKAFSVWEKEEQPSFKDAFIDTEKEDKISSLYNLDASQLKFLKRELQEAKVEQLPGKGIRILLNQCYYWLGNTRFLNTFAVSPTLKENLKLKADSLADEGKTIIFFGCDSEVLALLAVKDILKSEAKLTIDLLKKEGLKVGLLTGDLHKVAASFQKQLDLDIVESELYPEDKFDILNKYQKEGFKVAMVGDGVNDALALTQADIGISLASGSDVSMETADVVLLNSDILKVPLTFMLARYTLRIIKQNLFWAFIYNVVLIPVAMGLFYPLWGVLLDPVLASLAMSFSSLFVVLNALRLNLFSFWYRKLDFSLASKEVKHASKMLENKVKLKDERNLLKEEKNKVLKPKKQITVYEMKPQQATLKTKKLFVTSKKFSSESNKVKKKNILSINLPKKRDLKKIKNSNVKLTSINLAREGSKFGAESQDFFKVKFNIASMTCQNCQKKIEKIMKDLKVFDININLGKKEVQAYFLDEKHLKDVLDELKSKNYEASSLERLD